MKKCIGMLLLFVVICAVFYMAAGGRDFTDNTESAWNPEGQAGSASDFDEEQEMKSIWFSYQDWNLLLRGKNQKGFSAQVETVMNNIISIGCNTVFVHTRAFGDAMYPSGYYPWSASCSGTIGIDPGYDPLEIFIEVAHSKNVNVHAWINPMRVMGEEEFSQIDNSYLIKQWYNEQSYQYYMVDTEGTYILIPGNPAVRELVANGAAELAANYEIDGIHMDDYFYPSGVDELEQKDVQYYQKQNSTVPIEQWRRDSVTAMMSEIYSAVKKANPEITVGVSPQSSLTSNYGKLYADVEKWITDGEVIDYVVPQIYFGFNNSSQPFDAAAAEWNRLVENSGVILYVGLAAYKIGLADDAYAGSGKTEWIEVLESSNDMLKRQIEYLNGLSNCGGYSFFDYKSFFNVDGTIKEAVQKELENLAEIE